MATTYDPIATQTLGSAAVSVTFSSIPSTYTDIVLVMTGTTNNPTDPVLTFNNDSGTNYSSTTLGGNGSAANSARYTSRSNMVIDYNSSFRPTPIAGPYIINIMNYANTSVYKTALCRANNASYGTDSVVGLWRSTSAINRIDILTGSSNTFDVGCTFTIYGIRAA